MTLLRGLGTALATPFAAGGGVDHGALRALAQWQVAQGADFLVPCGSTGEAQTLDDAERVAVVRTVVDAVAGRVPVMGGATVNDTRRAVDETRRIAGAGADWVLSATPYYNKPGQEGLVRHFTAVADASPVPVMLYNIPGRAAVNLAPATALRLAEHPRVRGIKESSGDLRQVMELLARRPATLGVYAGDDWIAPAVLALGGDGLVSVAGNAVPATMRALVHAGLDGRLAELRARTAELLPLFDALFVESNPVPVKAALALAGRAGDAVRLPLTPATAATRARLRDALAALGVPLTS